VVVSWLPLYQAHVVIERQPTDHHIG